MSNVGAVTIHDRDAGWWCWSVRAARFVESESVEIVRRERIEPELMIAIAGVGLRRSDWQPRAFVSFPKQRAVVFWKSQSSFAVAERSRVEAFGRGFEKC